MMRGGSRAPPNLRPSGVKTPGIRLKAAREMVYSHGVLGIVVYGPNELRTQHLPLWGRCRVGILLILEARRQRR